MGVGGAMRAPLIDRILVPVLFLVLAGVSLITAVSYFHTRSSVEQLALSQMRDTLRYLEKAIGEKVRGISSDAALWSKEEIFSLALGEGYLARSARAASERRLTERCALYGYGRIFLALPDGRLAAFSEPEMATRVVVGDRTYFKESMAGKPALETLASGRYTGKPVLIASAPVFGHSDKAEGVLALVMDMEVFAADLLQGIGIGASGRALILAEGGGLLASSSAAGRPMPREVIDDLLANPWTVARYEDGERQRMAMAFPTPKTGWVLVVEADSEDVLKPASSLAALNGVISLAVILLVAAALWLIKKAAGRLNASETRYRVLAETIPVGIATILDDGSVGYMNRKAQDILGLKKDTPQAPSWTSRFENRDGAPIPFAGLPMFEAISEGRSDLGRAVWYRQGEGDRRQFSLSAAPLSIGEERFAGAVCVLEDVTDRVRMQEMMVQTEKMLSVGGLAAGMAHEINNPLASILQSAQVIERRLDPGREPNIKVARELGQDLGAIHSYLERRGILGFMESITDAGLRASKIVRNMLTFARKSEGGYEPADISQLLDRTVDLASGDYDLKKRYDFKQIEVVRDYDPHMGRVLCQPTEIEQVFFNIIKNAAQAMKESAGNDERPRITLRTRMAGNMAVAEIEDNGPGMPEEVRRRIFEPFYTTKEVGSGTGLGLSVAYFIIAENHGGRIEVEPAPGGGTRFLVLLPAKSHS